MENSTKKDMHATGIFKASLELMWKMWTDPEHIVHWWGPNGFTTTIHTMDVKPEGEWNLTLHGPDGTNFPNRSVYKEIIPLKKIVFEHFNPHFMTTVLFEARDSETIVDWRAVFDSPEMRETIVNVHKADEGQKQNMQKLEKYLAAL